MSEALAALVWGLQRSCAVKGVCKAPHRTAEAFKLSQHLPHKKIKESLSCIVLCNDYFALWIMYINAEMILSCSSLIMQIKLSLNNRDTWVSHFQLMAFHKLIFNSPQSSHTINIMKNHRKVCSKISWVYQSKDLCIPDPDVKCKIIYINKE